MHLRPLTRCATALQCGYRARPTLSRRTITYHNEREPYDPEADQTPRKRYIFGAFAIIGIGAAVLSSVSKSVRSDSDESAYKKDPATDVEFPTTLELPGTPKLTLLGLGTRTVSFLGIKVYSVGFYADLWQHGFEPRVDGTPEERIEHIVRNTTCALRIGMLRYLQPYPEFDFSRITLARNSGYLTPEEEDALLQPVQTFKGLFPNVALPKHQPLHAVLMAPNTGSGARTLYFPELGRVDNPWLANEFFLAYFSGKGISPAMKKSVEDAISEVGGWAPSTGRKS